MVGVEVIMAAVSVMATVRAMGILITEVTLAMKWKWATVLVLMK